jgi:plastocyanin
MSDPDARARRARRYRLGVRLTRSLAPVAACALVLALAACGGGGDEHGGGDHGDQNAPVAKGARVIHVDARSFAYEPSTIRVKAGEDVAIELASEDSFHDFEVQGTHVVGAGSDETAKGGLRLDKPGRYTFFCSVPGHRASGMEGTIVVGRG